MGSRNSNLRTLIYAYDALLWEDKGERLENEVTAVNIVDLKCLGPKIQTLNSVNSNYLIFHHKLTAELKN
jgi:hypothetical protein